jgi:hypothetical protein
LTNYIHRGYEPGDEVEILKTFNLVFREVCGESYVDRGLDYWNWEFVECPFGHRISLAFTEDGTCAAQYAGVVYPMATKFGDCTFVHIVDSMAHPDHRRGLKRPGLFVNNAFPWFELCHEMGDAVMYGYPVPIAERIGKRYLEYHQLRVVNYLCRDVGEGSAECPPGVQVERSATVTTDVDDLFARMAQDKGCLTRRNAEFLEWRYVKIPGDDYEQYEVRRDGSLCGFMVLRPVHELAPGSCTIADWVVVQDDTEAMDALLAATTARARELGRQRLMAAFPDPSPEFANLQERGFAVVSSAEYEERRLTHRIYHPQMTTEWLQEHWWYTLGDSDLV